MEVLKIHLNAMKGYFADKNDVNIAISKSVYELTDPLQHRLDFTTVVE